MSKIGRYSSMILVVATVLPSSFALAKGKPKGGKAKEVESAEVSAVAPTAEQLLKDADRARGALEDGISWEIDVETFDEGVF